MEHTGENHEHIIFGIDLGTTYSCIAYVNKDGTPVIIPDSNGKHTVPSVVLFDGDQCIVGEEAKNSAVLYPEHVVTMVKREMGDGNWRAEWNHNTLRAEEISAFILRKLAIQAESSLGRPVKDVVITCPAYFGINEREATARAGQIAGLTVRTVINEPSAAAIMYGVQNDHDQVVLVYDLGGGTFDVTVIEIKKEAITVVATGGDHYLGGRDWDESVVRHLAEQWKYQAQSSDDPLDSEETEQDLWRKVEQAKWQLTTTRQTHIAFSHAGRRAGTMLTRDKFNELTGNLLERTITYTKLTLREAEVRGFKHIDTILLVGGATKMPQIKERLEAEFAIPCKFFEPDEAVAKGAAIYGQKLLIDEKIHIEIAELVDQPLANIDISEIPTQTRVIAKENVAKSMRMQQPLFDAFSNLRVTNVASHSFGIIVQDRAGRRKYIHNLILANDSLPKRKQRRFETPASSRTSLIIMENDKGSERVEDITVGQEIGHIILRLPPNLPIHAPFDVIFELDWQGRLHVTAHEPSSNAHIEADIDTAISLPDKELDALRERTSKLLIL